MADRETSNSDRHFRTPAGEKYLIFGLDEENYGVPVVRVKEIVRLPGVTPVPQMPEYVRGVINLRGKVIPVVDLRIRFRFPMKQKDASDRTCAVISMVEISPGVSTPVGMIVDRVEEVCALSPEEIEPPVQWGERLEWDYITGMGRSQGRVLALLDVDRVMAIQQASHPHQPGNSMESTHER